MATLEDILTDQMCKEFEGVDNPNEQIMITTAVGTCSCTTPHYARVGTECAICLEPVWTIKTAFVTCCGHVFHKNCMVPWQRLKNVNTCPMCRRKIGRMQHIGEFLSTDDSVLVRQSKRDTYELYISDERCRVCLGTYGLNYLNCDECKKFF